MTGDQGGAVSGLRGDAAIVGALAGALSSHFAGDAEEWTMQWVPGLIFGVAIAPLFL